MNYDSFAVKETNYISEFVAEVPLWSVIVYLVPSIRCIQWIHSKYLHTIYLTHYLLLIGVNILLRGLLHRSANLVVLDRRSWHPFWWTPVQRFQPWLQSTARSWNWWMPHAPSYGLSFIPEAQLNVGAKPAEPPLNWKSVYTNLT